MHLSPLTHARLIGAGRIAVGLAAVAVPTSFARPWLGAAADEEPTQVVTRAFGVRDALLGVLTIAAAAGPQGPAVLALVAVSDVVDCGATIAARRAIPPSGVATSALAAGAVVGSLKVALQLRAAR